MRGCHLLIHERPLHTPLYDVIAFAICDLLCRLGNHSEMDSTHVVHLWECCKCDSIDYNLRERHCSLCHSATVLRASCCMWCYSEFSVMCSNSSLHPNLAHCQPWFLLLKFCGWWRPSRLKCPTINLLLSLLREVLKIQNSSREEWFLHYLYDALHHFMICASVTCVRRVLFECH